MLRAYLEKWKWEVGAFFGGVGPESSDEELLRIAPDHPVFRISTLTTPLRRYLQRRWRRRRQRARQWTFAQRAIVVVASLQLLWALAGLVAEPSIDFGDDAVTEQVLGVDFNGVHALSGFLLFLPGLLLRAATEVGGLLRDLRRRPPSSSTGIWALFTTQPAWGVFTFPNNDADAVFHLATGALFAAIAAIQLALDRRAAS